MSGFSAAVNQTTASPNGSFEMTVAHNIYKCKKHELSFVQVAVLH
jgi:hypothetical protein